MYIMHENVYAAEGEDRTESGKRKEIERENVYTGGGEDRTESAKRTEIERSRGVATEC